MEISGTQTQLVNYINGNGVDDNEENLTDSESEFSQTSNGSMLGDIRSSIFGGASSAELRSGSNSINAANNSGASLSEVDSPSLNSEEDAIVTEMEDKFLQKFNSGQYSDYDPRAVALAGQYVLNQFDDEGDRTQTMGVIADSFHMDETSGDINEAIIGQAAQILESVEVDGELDTSSQFISDMSQVVDTESVIDPDNLDTVFEIVDNDVYEMDDMHSKDVIIIGAHAGHTLGNMISDAGGLGTGNGYSSGNADASNDALFADVLGKMSESDKNRLATTPLIVDIESGEVIGEITQEELRNQEDGPSYHENWADREGNSIEGQTIEYEGRTLNVVDSSFRWSSPIILDMEGDGVELGAADEGVVFDIDADGTSDQTAWTKEQDSFDDAFLVFDKDGNDQIDSGAELFGDQNGASNGYEELAKYDSNDDGKIDNQDVMDMDGDGDTEKVMETLELWADLDADGKVDEGELKSLQEMGVTSISTEYEGQVGDQQDEHGNDISLNSTFTRMVDGEEQTLQTVDAFFTKGTANYDAGSLEELTLNIMEDYDDFIMDRAVSLASQGPDSTPDYVSSSGTGASSGVSGEGSVEDAEAEAERQRQLAIKAQLESKISSLEGDIATLNGDLSSTNVEISQEELEAGVGGQLSVQETTVTVPVSNSQISEGGDEGGSSPAPTTQTVTPSNNDNSATLGALRSEAGNLEGDISIKNSEIQFTRAQIPDV